MMLLLVPVLCALAGLVVYAALRVTGVFDFPGAQTAPRVREATWRPWRSEATTFRERLEEIPTGFLLGVIIAAGAWIAGWIVVLVIGLHLLT